MSSGIRTPIDVSIETITDIAARDTDGILGATRVFEWVLRKIDGAPQVITGRQVVEFVYRTFGRFRLLRARIQFVDLDMFTTHEWVDVFRVTDLFHDLRVLDQGRFLRYVLQGQIRFQP